MKSLLVLIPTAGLLLSSAASAGPSAAAGLAARSFAMTAPASSGYVSQSGAMFGRIPSYKEHQLIALRDEGLKLQKADGGKLTPEHYAYLQSKLDAIQKKSR